MAINSISFSRNGNQELVTITRDTTDRTTVKIGKYSKVLTEKSQTINLTPYLREEINLAPIISGRYTDSDCAIAVEITADGTTYESGESYAIGDSAQDLEHCASDLPYRVIAHGQTDAVTVYLSKGNSADIEANQKVINEQNNEVGTLVATNIQPTTENIKVSKHLDDNSTLYSQDIHYIFRPMGLNGKRMAWINRYGALDFWNFDYLREQSFGATAETIYTHNGYKKIARTAEKVFVMETREATREALDALSFIIASPAVWIVNDDLTGNPTFEEVDVITEECKVFDSKEMIGLQIAYRPKQRVL